MPSDRSGGDPGPGKKKPKPGVKKTGLKACPICGKPAAEASRPFCSERCRDVDLNRWFSGSYAIAASSDDNAE